MIVGSAAIDITAQARADTIDALAKHSTAPGTVTMSLGGVARNIAEAAHRAIVSQTSDVPRSSLLISPIGDDAFGRMLIDETKQLGMRVDGFIKADQPTAICNMVLDKNGGLVGGIADMDITANLAEEKVVFISCHDFGSYSSSNISR